MFIFRHSHREMADQIPRDTEENKQNETNTRCVLLEIDEINRFLFTLFHQVPL